MSLYIKGLEMPKNCDECWIKNHGFGMVEHDEEWGTFWCKLAKGFCSDIRTKCPLVEVPPHGRLIDADALILDVRKHSESYFADDFAHEWVDKAPTVIEAEEATG